MKENPLQDWLAEATDDAVVTSPDDIDTEAQGNLRSYSLSRDQAATVGLAEVVKFVHFIVAARGRWLAAQKAGPMLLYCWHDEQAGQLRLSLVSTSHARLPFGCEVTTVADHDR